MLYNVNCEENSLIVVACHERGACNNAEDFRLLKELVPSPEPESNDRNTVFLYDDTYKDSVCLYNDNQVNLQKEMLYFWMMTTEMLCLSKRNTPNQKVLLFAFIPQGGTL